MTPRTKTKPQRLVATGFHVGISQATDSPSLHTALNRGEYAYCRICGAIAFYPAKSKRDKWRRRHWKQANHQDHQTNALDQANLWLSPEAQIRLAPYGIFSPTDHLISPEHQAAALESPRSPV